MQKRIEFDANSLLKLLVHYYQDHEDRVPLDAELVGAGVSVFFPRWVMLEATSDREWKDVPIDPQTQEPRPLHVRFEGHKTMSWGADQAKHTMDSWRQVIEAPNER